MQNFAIIKRIKEIFEKGENIIEFLKNVDGHKSNTLEDILIAYDLQSGSYVKHYLLHQEESEKYCKCIVNIVNTLEDFDSIIEIGVGEATTLNSVLNGLRCRPKTIFGLDISWSRLKWGHAFLNENNKKNVNLFVANLFEIPLPDNSVDVVYTSHSLEPNGGKEEDALKELYRIARKYVVLFEPAYELASPEAQERMLKHGYVTKLYESAKKLKFNILEYRLLEYTKNILNPTGIILIKKDAVKNEIPLYICPITHTTLITYNDSLLHSKESHLSYPIIENIPCLLKENAILTSSLLSDNKDIFRIK